MKLRPIWSERFARPPDVARRPGQQQDRRIAPRRRRAPPCRPRAGASRPRSHIRRRRSAAAGFRDQPADLGAGHKADIGKSERLSERPGLGIQLARSVSGKASQGVCAGEPALDVDGQRQGEGMQPEPLRAAPASRRSAGSSGTAERDRRWSAAARSGPRRPRRAPGTAPRPGRTRARARHRGSAKPARRRRHAPSPRNPARGSGSARRRRISNCRRHSSNCPD